MRNLLLLLVVGIFLAGCATAPSLPQVQLHRGDRIGVLVDSGDTPSHSHIGTTVFNNFNKQYPYNWNLRAGVSDAVSKSFGAEGLVVVDLAKEGLNYSDLSNLIAPVHDEWKVARRKEAIYHRLSEQMGLKAVVILKEGHVTTALECYGGPCAERFADASGLYTRSMLGMTHYYAVAAYRWNVYVLNPAADIAAVNPLRETLYIPAKVIPKFAEPAKFDNITEAELAPVREAVIKLVELNATEAARSLNVR